MTAPATPADVTEAEIAAALKALMPPGRAPAGDNTDALLRAIAAQLKQTYATLDTALYAAIAGHGYADEWTAVTRTGSVADAISTLRRAGLRTVGDLRHAILTFPELQEITEIPAFRCGVSAAGDRIGMPSALVWRTTALTQFVAGANACGDSLGNDPDATAAHRWVERHLSAHVTTTTLTGCSKLLELDDAAAVPANVLGDLESSGYTASGGVLTAADEGAAHVTLDSVDITNKTLLLTCEATNGRDNHEVIMSHDSAEIILQHGRAVLGVNNIPHAIDGEEVLTTPIADCGWGFEYGGEGDFNVLPDGIGTFSSAGVTQGLLGGAQFPDADNGAFVQMQQDWMAIGESRVVFALYKISNGGTLVPFLHFGDDEQGLTVYWDKVNNRIQIDQRDNGATATVASAAAPDWFVPHAISTLLIFVITRTNYPVFDVRVSFNRAGGFGEAGKVLYLAADAITYASNPPTTLAQWGGDAKLYNWRGLIYRGATFTRDKNNPDVPSAAAMQEYSIVAVDAPPQPTLQRHTRRYAMQITHSSDERINRYDWGVGWTAAAAALDASDVDSLGGFGIDWGHSGSTQIQDDGWIKWHDNDTSRQEIENPFFELREGRTLFMSMRATRGADTTNPYLFSLHNSLDNDYLGIAIVGDEIQIRNRHGTVTSAIADITDWPVGYDAIVNVRIAAQTGNAFAVRASLQSGDATHTATATITLSGGNGDFRIGSGGTSAVENWNGWIRELGGLVRSTGHTDIPSDDQMNEWAPEDGVAKGDYSNVYDGGVGWVSADSRKEQGGLGSFGGDWTNTGGVTYDGFNGHLRWKDNDTDIQHLQREIALADGETLFVSMRAVKGSDNTRPYWFCWGEDANLFGLGDDAGVFMIYRRVNNTWGSVALAGSNDITATAPHTLNVKITRSGNTVTCRCVIVQDDNVAQATLSATFTTLPTGKLTIGFLDWEGKTGQYSWDDDIWQAAYFVRPNGHADIPTDDEMQSWQPTDGIVFAANSSTDIIAYEIHPDGLHQHRAIQHDAELAPSRPRFGNASTPTPDSTLRGVLRWCRAYLFDEQQPDDVVFSLLRTADSPRNNLPDG